MTLRGELVLEETMVLTYGWLRYDDDDGDELIL